MEPTLNQIVDGIKKELEPQIAVINDRVAIVADINKRLTELESGVAERQSAITDGLTELRDRITRREKLNTESSDLRVMESGRIRPRTSRECAEHVLDTLKASFAGNRAHSAGVDGEGGFLVAPEYADEILRLIPTVGAYRRLARIVPMLTDEKNFGKLLTGLTMYWPGENSAITPSYATFGQLKLSAKLLAGITDAPENLLEDSSPELGELLIDLFVEGLGGEEDRVGFTGGAADPFYGITQIAGTVAVPLAAGKTHISDTDPDSLLSMQTAVPDGARARGIYVLSPTVLDGIRKIKETTGNYIFQPPTQGAPATIWGRPFELVEQMPAWSNAVNAGAPIMAYGDPRMLFLGDRKRLAVARSMVAGDAFKNVQEVIRIHERIAINSYAGAWAVLKTAAA